MEAEQKFLFPQKKAEISVELCACGDAKKKMVLGGFLLSPVLGTTSKSETRKD